MKLLIGTFLLILITGFAPRAHAIDCSQNAVVRIVMEATPSQYIPLESAYYEVRKAYEYIGRCMAISSPAEVDSILIPATNQVDAIYSKLEAAKQRPFGQEPTEMATPVEERTASPVVEPQAPMPKIQLLPPRPRPMRQLG